jgi:PAS domain S-box-containing protein
LNVFSGNAAFRWVAGNEADRTEDAMVRHRLDERTVSSVRAARTRGEGCGPSAHRRRADLTPRAPGCDPGGRAGHATGPPARILVVEDDLVQAETVRGWLEGAGYDVTGVAPDERQALDLACARQADLALVDVRLGARGDGIRAARGIERTAGTPVVFVTGYPDAVEAAEVGLGWIRKPTVETELLAGVQAALAVATGVVPLHPPQALRLRSRPAPPPAVLGAGRRLTAVMDSAPHGIGLVDGALRIVEANAALADQLGLAPTSLLGAPIGELAAGDDGLSAALRACFAGEPETLAPREWVARRGDGELVLLAVSGDLVRDRDGMPAAVVLHLCDVNREARSQPVRPAALHDELTGLGTVALFMDRLELACARAARCGTPFAVVLIELDGVGELDPGALRGEVDSLIAAVGAAIDDRRRDVDAAAHLARGLFALVLDGPSRDGALGMARELAGRVMQPFRVGRGTLTPGGCVGVAWSDDGRPGAETMFQRADMALLRAKRLGPGMVSSDPE